MSSASEMMAVDVRTEGDLEPGAPHLLFGPQSDWIMPSVPWGGVQFDVAPDGRFVIARMVSPTQPNKPPTTFIDTNFFEKLRERMSGN